jgi:hypothetical protein
MSAGLCCIASNSNVVDHPNLFHGFSNAVHANGDNRKSIARYVFITGGGAITWQLKQQMAVALSSTESEYVALSEVAHEACWLRSLHEELGFPQRSPTVIQSNNKGVIAIAKNRQYHKRSKHIDV